MRNIALASAIILSAMSGSVAAGGDPVAGKKKAMLCVSCHGANGISVGPLWPNLAGQKAAYTSKQLKAFRSGERNDMMMSQYAKTLSDDDIEDLAAYYEKLK
jgi:cytochrome c553